MPSITKQKEADRFSLSITVLTGLAEMAASSRRFVPIWVLAMHGQMEGHELEENTDFIDGGMMLVCTNIVESGVDIPNVNTIIKQQCASSASVIFTSCGKEWVATIKSILLPAGAAQSNTRWFTKRLQTLEQHSDLGSGFQIAMRDLDIRGAGNMLGGEQSGFMARLVLKCTRKILDEAIRELNEQVSKTCSGRDFQTGWFLYRIVHYWYWPGDTDGWLCGKSITERLSLYQRLDNCENDEELEAMKRELSIAFNQCRPRWKIYLQLCAAENWLLI